MISALIRLFLDSSRALLSDEKRGGIEVGRETSITKKPLLSEAFLRQVLFRNDTVFANRKCSIAYRIWLEPEDRPVAAQPLGLSS